MYEGWRERKKYIINMNQGGVGPRDQKIGVNKKYIKNIEIDRGRPEDPFAISKFVEENNVSMKKMEVIRLLAIGSLPMDVEKGLDEGYIDIHTAI